VKAAAVQISPVLYSRQGTVEAGLRLAAVAAVGHQDQADRAVACTGWPIELHDTPQGYVWEPFGDDHLHYVPLGSLLSPDCANLAAAGRCVDGDVAALSSVRVMGPCIAMGAAAAHALDLAGSGSVHQIDATALRRRLHDNIERKD